MTSRVWNRPVPPETGPARALPPSRGGLRLGQIAGVAVQVDWSVLLIFTLITFNMGVGVLPSWHPQWAPALRWLVAILAALLFFSSILAHELSHALVGRANGIVVRRITLFIFGGMAHMENQPPSPRAELLMAVVGPITSIGIGVLATLGAVLLAPAMTPELVAQDPKAVMESLGVGATLLAWLGPINFILGVFNLVPGFPLDGGRVLRALVWWLTGDLMKATRWAAGAGQVFAWLLMGFGIMSLFSGVIAQGLWFLVIGWFLGNAARMSYQQVLIHRTLEGVALARVMRTHLEVVPAELSVDELVRGYLMASDQRAFPVLGLDGRLLGLVRFEDVRRVPSDAWQGTTVGEVMTPVDELETLPVGAMADAALDRLASRGVEEIAVTEGDRLLGIVQLGDIMKYLRLYAPASAAA